MFEFMINTAPPASNSVFQVFDRLKYSFDITKLIFQIMCVTVVQWSRSCLYVQINLDCKTVRIFTYSSMREQLNKRSATRLKTESETGESHFFSLRFFSRLTRPYGRVRLARFARIRLLHYALPFSLLILRKKNRLSLQSKINRVRLPCRCFLFLCTVFFFCLVFVFKHYFSFWPVFLYSYC